MKCLWILAAICLTATVSAELVSVSQMGYHPQANKQVLSYSSQSTGSFRIHDASSGTILFTGTLQKARDANGNIVNCQGNNPCLLGDFSSFTTNGNYYITTTIGGRSPSFSIQPTMYSTQAATMLEFFDATLQQSSAYHADFHKGLNPAFPIMADGSFLMVADQAGFTLIRLGSAYNRNPQLFQINKYDIYASNKPDMQEYIRAYVKQLEAIQGVQLQKRYDGQGFRTRSGFAINNIFVPGPTSLQSMDVYTSGDNPSRIQSAPVVSLCGADDGSARWDKCIADAALYYKCQVNEPCINMTYNDETATISGYSGYAVSRGWAYDFSCMFDVNLDQQLFVTGPNPCFFFDAETSRRYTTITLLAYAEALPAINDYSATEGQALFSRTMNTYQYIKATYPAYTATDGDTPYFAAALFLLYDYTGDEKYLREAHAMRTLVSQSLPVDSTKGNEFYWEEYVKHKQAITNAGLTYAVSGVDPAEFFRGKMYGDWKDRGERSISTSAERVFQFDHNIQFQNSRFMLIEGVLAAKTSSVYPGIESFVPVIANNQLYWLSGMNAVQLGDSTGGSPIGSRSFIFGIGNNPNEYHTRFHMQSNYSKQSGGQIIGSRNTDLQFYNGTGYVYFDGATNILGYKFGALGNGYNGEPKLQMLYPQPFTNGKTIIPGWISGAYDIQYDNDVIFNYVDNREVWQFTETTNEMVGTALELMSYQDALYNKRAAIVKPRFSGAGNYTPPPPSGNNSSTCYAQVNDMPASCAGGTITSDNKNGCRTVACASSGATLQIMACDKPGSYNAQYFEMYKQSSTSSGLSICIAGTCISSSGSGYVKSANMCTASTAPPPPPPTCTPSTETCNQKDDDCDGLIDESNVCAPTSTTGVKVRVADWYPKGRDYVFICDASGATSYSWYFGDGNKQLNSASKDVYYRYSVPGTYTVMCEAAGSSGTLAVTVA
jgi:hypothetical protein